MRSEDKVIFPIIGFIILALVLFLGIVATKGVKHSEIVKQGQSDSIIIRGNGNSIVVKQSGNDSSYVEINGEKWVNGQKIK